MKVIYLESVLEKDIFKIPIDTRKRILDAIERKLMVAPAVYSKPLSGIFRGYYKFRVGQYRVVYRIEKQAIIVVVIISHRKDVYQKLEGRS